jgi:hypothetical protein
MPRVPASPARSLFKCPYKDEHFAARGAIPGRLDGSQERLDGLDPSFGRGQVMDDGNGDCKIEA